MKIIFLDIDGVLNGRYNYFFGLDPHKIDMLNVLTSRTRARIVVTSMWRLGGMEYVRGVFSRARCNSDVMDITPTEDESRGKQIKKWLKTHKVEQYVILDDDRDMDGLEDHLIRVDSRVGLTMQDVDKAVKILNGGVE